jgi:hypothetical protein
MSTTGPANMAEALELVDSGMRFLAGMDKAGMPCEQLAASLQALEWHDAVEAAVRGEILAVYDAQGGPVGDGQRTTKAWMMNTTRVTRGQAAEHIAVQRLAETHPVLLAALAEGDVISKSVALQVAKWTAEIPDESRDQAEEILVTAARDGADLRGLAALYAEIRARTASADPDDPDPGPDRGLSLDTTIDGAGVIRGDLTAECSAMVQAVLDALSAPEAGGDSRTHRERYHDAMAEAMRRLLASDLLPKRAGQPVKALTHIHFSELIDLDHDSALRDKWAEDYRARWAAQRAAASVSTGDGGAWLEGDAARAVAGDAMIIPVVTADIDPAAIEGLITACVQYDRIRTHPAPDDGATGSTAEVLAMLEHQILAAVLQVVSGPGGVASFLRRNLLGKGLNGPSLPLDVGQTDEIPVHLRRLVALRDQTCRFSGGCDQPASRCEPHHIRHRKDGGHTSLSGLQEWCWFHHHVVLHQMGWQLIVHPDGTSQVTSPTGKIIRSHSPPPGRLREGPFRKRIT